VGGDPVGGDPVTGGRPVSRRTVLRGLGLAGLAAAAGCGAGDDRPPVRVAVVWSGDELRQFRRAAAGSGLRVSAVSLGDNAETLLRGGLAPALAPDVAILPQPTLIGTGAGLVDLRDVLTPPDVGEPWATLARDTGGVPRGVWYKATHKSLVWYRQDVFDRYGVTAPATWADWTGLCAELAGRGVTPLALGAGDGWVVTDWFENVLLARAPGPRSGLLDPATAARGWPDPADQEQVGAALRDLAEIWRPEWLPGGTERALQLQFGDSVLDVMARGRAAMVAGADFTYPVATRFAPADQVGCFLLPRPPRRAAAPVLVGGDLAVLFTGARPGGADFVRWLATPAAAAGWARSGGFVSLDRDVVDYPRVYGTILADLRSAKPLQYDLSDRLPPGGLGGGDGRRGLSWVLQEFLRALPRGRPDGPPTPAVAAGREAAVAAALARLAAAGRSG
jgi:ABC-type glycerol-3-phosphate transport system substrate-binding protein